MSQPLTFDVTRAEFNDMLSALKQHGGKVTPDSPVSGTVEMRKFWVTVRAPYRLEDGTLTLTPDGHADEVEQQVKSFLYKRRAGQPV